MDQGKKDTGTIPKAVTTRYGRVVNKPERYSPELTRKVSTKGKSKESHKMASGETQHDKEREKLEEMHEADRALLHKKFEEENSKAQARWKVLKESSKFPSGPEGDEMRLNLEKQIQSEQLELDYKHKQEELAFEESVVIKAVGEEKRKEFEKYKAKMTAMNPSYEYKWSDRRPEFSWSEQSMRSSAYQGLQSRQYQTPNINTVANNIALANPQMKVFKGRRREDDLHFTPGCDVLDWFQSMENFFNTKNITSDLEKIEWLPGFCDPASGNAMMLIGNIANDMKTNKTYQEVKAYIIRIYAGTTVDDFVGLSTQILGNHPPVREISQISERIIVLRRHLARLVKSYMDSPRYMAKYNGATIEDEEKLLEFIFSTVAAGMFSRSATEKVLLARPPPGEYRENTISLSIRLDEWLTKNTSAEEAYRRSKEHHDKEKNSFLNARASLGVTDSRKRGEVHSVETTATQESTEANKIEGENIEEDTVNVISQGNNNKNYANKNSANNNNRNNNNSNSGNGGNQNYSCLLCGRSGHTYGRCRHRPGNLSKEQCYCCGGTGHRASDHNLVKRNPGPRKVGTSCNVCKGLMHIAACCPSNQLTHNTGGNFPNNAQPRAAT